MKKYLILLSGLVGSTIVLASFSQPAKDDNEQLIEAGVNLVETGFNLLSMARHALVQTDVF